MASSDPVDLQKGNKTWRFPQALDDWRFPFGEGREYEFLVAYYMSFNWCSSSSIACFPELQFILPILSMNK